MTTAPASSTAYHQALHAGVVWVEFRGRDRNAGRGGVNVTHV